jgi:PPOX class probable F420-dependent enzyme
MSTTDDQATDDQTPDDDARRLEVLTAGRLAVLATIRRDGRPQLSNVGYRYDPATGTARVSVTAGRAKTANLRRDSRGSLLVTAADRWSYAAADVTAELSPVSESPNDPTVDALVELYRALSGEHPDWAEYRAAMVADRRLLLTLTVERIYGFVR